MFVLSFARANWPDSCHVAVLNGGVSFCCFWFLEQERQENRGGSLVVVESGLPAVPKKDNHGKVEMFLSFECWKMTMEAHAEYSPVIGYP